MTYDEFHEHVAGFKNRFDNRDLQDYLQALLGLVVSPRDLPLTTHQLLQWLEQAFTAPAAPFDSGWLSATTPPDENMLSRKFTHPAIADLVHKPAQHQQQAGDYTLAVLHFQIADLHKMRGKPLENDHRYFGIDSETGNRWYNFDPIGLLECGARGLCDNADSEDDEFVVQPHSLGDLLEMGRVYE